MIKKGYYGAREPKTINKNYYLGNIELDLDSIIINENTYWKNKIEYNQYYINNSMCTIIAGCGILSNYFNYTFSKEKLLKLIELAKKENPPFVDGKGWLVSKGANLVKNEWNKMFSDKQIEVYTVEVGSDEFYNLLKKGYHIQSGYRGNTLYNNDMKDDCILNEIYDVKNSTYGHSIYFAYKDGNIYIVDSYKGRKCNVYKIEDFNKRKKMFFKNGYVFIIKNNIMKGLNEDIELIKKAIELGITKNKKNLENIKKGKYTQDVKTLLMVMRAFNIIQKQI